MGDLFHAAAAESRNGRAFCLDCGVGQRATELGSGSLGVLVAVHTRRLLSAVSGWCARCAAGVLAARVRSSFPAAGLAVPGRETPAPRCTLRMRCGGRRRFTVLLGTPALPVAFQS